MMTEANTKYNINERKALPFRHYEQRGISKKRAKTEKHTEFWQSRFSTATIFEGFLNICIYGHTNLLQNILYAFAKYCQ